MLYFLFWGLDFNKSLLFYINVQRHLIVKYFKEQIQFFIKIYTIYTYEIGLKSTKLWKCFRNFRISLKTLRFFPNGLAIYKLDKATKLMVALCSFIDLTVKYAILKCHVSVGLSFLVKYIAILPLFSVHLPKKRLGILPFKLLRTEICENHPAEKLLSCLITLILGSKIKKLIMYWNTFLEKYSHFMAVKILKCLRQMHFLYISNSSVSNFDKLNFTSSYLHIHTLEIISYFCIANRAYKFQ